MTYGQRTLGVGAYLHKKQYKRLFHICSYLFLILINWILLLVNWILIVIK